MFLISGKIISIVTFPGLIVHVIAHRFFCDLMKLPVYEVCYWKYGETAGYVVHAREENLRQSFLILMGPLIVNSILCCLITFTAVFPIFILYDDNISPIFFLLIWLGMSIGMHAFPSTQNVDSFLDFAQEERQNRPILYILILFFGYFLKLINWLRFFWLDALYAHLLIRILPFLLLYLLK